MNRRRFSLKDQALFAELSGDWNPIHVDPIQARRLLFGGCVAHGIHAVMWMLDAYLADHDAPAALTWIKAKFVGPVRVEQDVHLEIENRSPQHVLGRLTGDGELLLLAEFQWAPSHAPEEEGEEDERVLDALSADARPNDFTIDDIQNRSGSVALGANIDESTRALFSVLVDRLPVSQLAVLLASTRLVGMVCPGLHSLFAELELSFETGDSTELKYDVKRADDRFGLVQIAVSGAGADGSIRAFVRPRPIAQRSFEESRLLIDRHEFAGQNSLIIGGSRGLGASVAKLLAAGGASVKLSYVQGQEDAESIVEDITTNGGVADAFRYDALDEAHELQGTFGGWQPTHIYYFATPFISSNSGPFSSSLFELFTRYYVLGLSRLIDGIPEDWRLGLFYPSTVFLEQPDSKFTEYATAKGAGEVLARFLENQRENLSVYCPRLPRMGTDQTSGILAVPASDTSTTLLAQLRIFRDSNA